MADYNEITFEQEIAEYLAARGWLYSPNDDGYDHERALFPEDIFGWLADTQPDELTKVLKRDTPVERGQVLDRLVKVLETPLESGGGTLNVLRKGFSHIAARFDLCQFKPESTLNPATVERYDKVRVRVTKTKIEVWIDDKSVVDVDYSDKRIGIRIEVDLSKPLGFTTYRTMGALRSIQLTKLSPDEKSGK